MMTPNPRCVIDTNIFISGALSSHGTSNQAVFAAIDQGELLASKATFAELEAKLLLPKFDRYLTKGERRDYLAFLLGSSRFFEITERTTASPDPKDNMFLELAVSANADVIITGDKKHLLPLHPFRGISIVDPAAFLEVIGA